MSDLADFISKHIDDQDNGNNQGDIPDSYRGGTNVDDVIEHLENEKKIKEKNIRNELAYRQQQEAYLAHQRMNDEINKRVETFSENKNVEKQEEYTEENVVDLNRNIIVEETDEKSEKKVEETLLTKLTKDYKITLFVILLVIVIMNVHLTSFLNTKIPYLSNTIFTFLLKVFILAITFHLTYALYLKS